MNALSLAGSAAAAFIISTSPNLAQEIKALFGVLHMEMSIAEAEAALKSKSRTTEHGAVFLHSDFNGMSYYIWFNCIDRFSQCDRQDMKPVTIESVYRNEVSFDIRPREVAEILKNFGFYNVQARYDTDCAFWTTKTAIVDVGRVCSSWGIRMRNKKISWGYHPLGCRAGCF